MVFFKTEQLKTLVRCTRNVHIDSFQSVTCLGKDLSEITECERNNLKIGLSCTTVSK